MSGTALERNQKQQNISQAFSQCSKGEVFREYGRSCSSHLQRSSCLCLKGVWRVMLGRAYLDARRGEQAVWTCCGSLQ